MLTCGSHPLHVFYTHIFCCKYSNVYCTLHTFSHTNTHTFRNSHLFILLILSFAQYSDIHTAKVHPCFMVMMIPEHDNVIIIFFSATARFGLNNAIVYRPVNLDLQRCRTIIILFRVMLLQLYKLAQQYSYKDINAQGRSETGSKTISLFPEPGKSFATNNSME